MKKLFLLFLLFFTTNSFASGIASNTASAPCTNTTLETYSGNSNLSADWQPNEIQLRWYNGNTLMDVQSAANTCIYDDTLTVPSTAPTRTGYTFAGWTVRPEMDFSTLNTSENGLERWAKGDNSSGAGTIICQHDMNDGPTIQVACDSDNNFDELQRYEWKVKFNHGNLYGMSLCSTTDGGTTGNRGTPAVEFGKYCWCKVTGYSVTNSNVINAPSSNMPWVFMFDKAALSDWGCGRYCAPYCAYWIEYRSFFRISLYTPAQ